MDTRLRIGLLTAALAGLGAGLPAQVPAPDSLPAGVTSSMVAKGRAVFGGQGICIACHGPDGRGAVGPSLADSAWLHSDGSYEGIVSTITAGVSARASKSGVVMPPRGGSGINDEDLRAVAAYVWSLRFQPRTARLRRGCRHPDRCM